MANKFFSVTLNASGAITASEILSPNDGIIRSIRLSKNGQSNNPSVTIEKDPSGEDILTAITLNATASYYPQAEIQTVAGVATGLRTPFEMSGFRLTITVTGGDNGGVVSGYVEFRQ